MKAYITKKGVLTIALGLILVMSTPKLVGAISMETKNSEPRVDTSTLRQEAKELREEKKQQAEEARDTKKVARCESRKAHIDQLMNEIDSRSNRIYNRLTGVSKLVQDYYEKSGLKIDNYESLVADINQKKGEAKTKLDTMLMHGPLSCDADNPRESVKEFRDSRQMKVTAMKAYRASVRTLLTEVKQAMTAAKNTTSSQSNGDAS